MLPMVGSDLSTPRKMGAFVLAIRADGVIDAASFREGMQRYLDTLHASPVRAGGAVLAPGDREWAEAARREAQGVPIDPEYGAGIPRNERPVRHCPAVPRNILSGADFAHSRHF